MTSMETMLASLLHLNLREKIYLRMFPNPFDEDCSISTRMNVVKHKMARCLVRHPSHKYYHYSNCIPSVNILFYEMFIAIFPICLFSCKKVKASSTLSKGNVLPTTGWMSCFSIKVSNARNSSLLPIVEPIN